jgi:hypothetical protein
MAVLSKLVVELGFDGKGFRSGLNDVKNDLNKWGASLRDVGTKATLGLTLPIAAGFGLLIKSASDLNEAQSATDTIYGDSAVAVSKWAKTTADAYGITNQEALNSVNMLGQIFKGFDISEDAAAGFSMQIVEAAGDLASFNNTNPADVLNDLRAGLVGEAEPLRKYGILLDEASVAQRAMEMTGKTNADQLTASEKVLARQELILDGLGDAQGDAARTADSLANVIRRLRARGVDLAAKWGQLLLPNVLKFSQFLLRVTTAIENLSPRMQKLIMVGLALAAAIGPVLIALGMMIPALLALTGPLGLVILAIGLLAAAFATDFMGIRGHVMSVVEVLGTLSRYFKRAFDSGESVKALTAALPEPLQKVGRAFFLVADAVGDLVAAFKKDGLSGVWEALPGELGQVWEALRILASEGFGKLKEAFFGIPWADIGLSVLALGQAAFGAIPWGDIWDGISGFFTGIWNAFQKFDYNSLGVTVGEGIRTAIESVGPTLLAVGGKIIRSLYDGITGADWQDVLMWVALIPVAIPAAIIGATAVLIPKGKEFIMGLMEGLGVNWEEVTAWFNTRDEAALMAIGTLTATLLQKGKDLIDGLRDGASEKWNTFTGWLKNRGAIAVNFIGDLTETLLQKGKDLIQGLRDGALDVWDILLEWLDGRANAILGAIGDLSGLLYDVGYGIVQGMADGLYAGAGLVISAAQYLADLIPGPIKKILGMASPSKLMRALMVNVPKGMALGMKDGERLVSNASASLAGASIPQVGYSGMGMLGGNGSGGSNTNYGGITINVSGAGDPDAVADRVFAKFSREMALA